MSKNKISCTVCKSHDNKKWGEKNGYTFYACKNCTHIFTITEHYDYLEIDTNVFRKIFTHNLMENDEKYYQHLKTGEKLCDHTNITCNIILEFIKQFGARGAEWLDVGCGSGYLLMKLGEMNHKAIGIEPGGWGQIAAKERNLNIIQGFLNKSTFSHMFYVVSATDVLEHQQKPIEFLNILKHYVYQNGYIILSIPFIESFNGKIYKTKWDMISPPTHSQFFTNKSLKYACEILELKIIKIIKYNSSKLPILGKYQKIQLCYNYFVKNTILSDQALIIMQKK